MSTDLDDRITDLLARSGAAVDVRPDLDAVLADDRAPAPLVDLRSSPRANRRRLALAAAALVVLAAVAAGVATRGDQGDRTEVATGPGSDAGTYPVLDVLPEDVVGTPHATDVLEATDVLVGDDGPIPEGTVRAVLGRPRPDGSIDRLALVVVGYGPADAPDAGDPRVQYRGDDDTAAAVLQQTPPAVVPGRDEEGAPTLDIGELPDGIEVLVEPGPAPAGVEHVVTIDAPATDEGDEGDDEGIPRSISVRTGGDVPLAALARYEGAEPVDVGGRPGWHAPRIDGGLVAWTAADGTNVLVDVTGYGPDHDLAVAEGIRLVDRDEWTRTYPQDGPPGPVETLPAPTTSATDPSPTDVAPSPPTGSHELDGQPAPPPPGDVVAGTWPGYDGRWTVVLFGATWCVPCRDLWDDLDARGDDLGFAADVQVVEVLLESPADSVADHIADHGPAVVVTAAPALEPWRLSGVPALAIVGPDGIVRSVREAGGRPDDVDAALAAARDGG